MDREIVYQEAIGPQKTWVLIVYKDENGNLIPEISRPDGKFFRVAFATKGYDRPIVENFGPSVVSLVIDKHGAIAVEPETIILNIEKGTDYNQNRVLRASADNPNYEGIPKGIGTGQNYPDGQRVIYRDDWPQSVAVATNQPPKRKTKEGFKPCQTMILSDFGETMDSPGKASIFDAFAFCMPGLLNFMGKILFWKLKWLKKASK